MPVTPHENIYIRARWRGRLLSWYWSGEYWYCVAENIKGPTGVGKTKDISFLDYKSQLNQGEGPS